MNTASADRRPPIPPAREFTRRWIALKTLEPAAAGTQRWKLVDNCSQFPLQSIAYREMHGLYASPDNQLTRHLAYTSR